MTNNNSNINELVINEFLESLGIVEVERKGSKTKKNKKQKRISKIRYNSNYNSGNKSNVSDEFLLSL